MRQLMLLIALSVVGLTGGVRAQIDTVYRPGDGVTLPAVVKQVNPSYTNEAKQQRIEGVVGLSCVVRPDGHVTDIVVTESLDSVFGLDGQAVEAMGKWEFKLGTKDNKPVPVQIEVKMNFTLR